MMMITTPTPSLTHTFTLSPHQLMMMTLSSALLEEWLVPVAALRPQDYRFGTVGKDKPMITISAAE